MSSRIINVLIVLFGGAIYLWAGVEWSQSTWARGGLEFDQGWLLVALIISQLAISRLGGGKLDQQKWLRIIPTALVGFALEALSDRLFIRLTNQPSRSHAIYFAVFASLFLVYIVALIAVFPYENFFGPFADGERWPWQRLVRGTSILIVLITISGAAWCFHQVGAPIANISSALQAWFYKDALLVYIFLALRMLYPVFEMRFRHLHRWS